MFKKIFTSTFCGFSFPSSRFITRSSTYLISLVVSCLLSCNVYAGIPTIDPAAIAQQLITSLKQIEQYKTQLKQYEDMLKNSKNPKDFVWGDLAKTLKDLEQKQQELADLQKLIGDAKTFGEFKTVADFADHPCLDVKNTKGCSENELKELAEQAITTQEAKQKATTSSYKLSVDATQEVHNDALKLEQLQRQAEKSSGTNELLHIHNQIAAIQTKQLLRQNELAAEQLRQQAVKDKLEQERAKQNQAISAKKMYIPKYKQNDIQVSNDTW